jgi:guanylate kinase
VLVNRDLQKSYERLRSILTAERLKRVKLPDLERFVGGLLGDLKKLTP